MASSKTNSDKLSPEQVGVKTLPTDELTPNPHNPRVLFDVAPLDTLKESIGKVGILVPLTIYFDSNRKKHIILDGQRRWICAQQLGLAKVPVNQVSEPTLVQNIVTMFQIHKLREDWELMPSALKLELLMNELEERNDKKLATLTGLDQAVVQRCKKLLSYTKKYQDMMLDPEPKNRIKADFFIELYVVRNDKLVNSFDWYKKDRFTKQMLDRYLAKRLKSVTDFRKIKQSINQARLAGKEKAVSKRLQEFAENQDFDIDHLEISAATVSAEAKSMTKQANQMAVIFIEFAGISVAQWSTLKARRGGTRVKCGWLLALQGTLTRKKSNRRSSTSNLSSRTVMRTMDHSRFMVRTLALGLASQAIACRRFETWWFVADFSSHKAQQSTGQACGIRIPLATFTHAKMQSRISRH